MNNFSLIVKCLCSNSVNLNSLNSENKTPLAYGKRSVLKRLYLEEGVVSVQNRKCEFDNNCLLKKDRLQEEYEEMLTFKGKEL